MYIMLRPWFIRDLDSDTVEYNVQKCSGTIRTDCVLLNIHLIVA